MEDSNVELNDLPNEALVIILRKLNNFDIHYSLKDVNQRLNQIIRESVFTNRLSFIKKSSENFIDRFCLQILPRIHSKIKWLDVESTSMRSILRAFDYPNLHILGLYNIDEESARSLVIDQTLSTDIFTNQIKTLILTCIRDEDYVKMLSSVANIFECIFPIFTKLIDLILHELSYRNCVRLNFNDSLILNFRSKMLLNLKASSF
ncbi:hypothetical protein I4U23_007263 [Adineta vaga]|nr:hypothetical protein I4U23_007263 [Adineta vaga]